MSLKFTSLVACAVVLIDQLSKFLALNFIKPFESIPIIKNIFHLSLVLNSGIAFGLFKNQVIFYLVLPAVAIIWLVFNLFLSREEKNFDRMYFFAMSLILGGAVGNLIDRLRLGYVVDFLDFRIWPVFNLADSAITIGVAIIIFKCIPLSAK